MPKPVPVDGGHRRLANPAMMLRMNWAAVARRQGGVITRSQLLAVRITRDRIDNLARRGLLLPSGYRGVYHVAGAPRSPESEAWTAVLGSGAVLSYLSAAAWWDLPVDQDGRIHITKHERRRNAVHRLVRVHRTLLVPSAVTSRFGLPITTRTETLLDCLGWLGIRPARDLLDRAFQQNWLTRQDIERRLDEQAGRWGNRQLARLLRESKPGAEAESERRGQKLLDQAGITGWIGNLPIVLAGEGFRIDIAFPAHKLAVEIDGWAFHRSRARRDRDNRKANLLTKAGWRVLTFSWEDVNERPDYYLDSICSVLASQAAI
jgi:very-short-patch-repair endonuclease